MSKGAKGESGKRDVIEAKGKRISREDLGVNMLMLKRNSSVVGTSGSNSTRKTSWALGSSRLTSPVT